MIDFTKPIRHKDFGQDTIKVLFHDERSILYELSDGRRFNRDINLFKLAYQNITFERKKIKGFIGIDDEHCCTEIYELKSQIFDYNNHKKIIAIIEINATEGEGLQ
jgi:hypothetical protein